jgi:hypothetical protein
MWRVQRLPLVLGWLSGYCLMGLLRMALGQGGLIFALGPMTGAEFTLFTFSMIPDPKTSPSVPHSQVLWGLTLGLLDGVMRLAEIRFSMFYALFILCAVRYWISPVTERIRGIMLFRTPLRAPGLTGGKAEQVSGADAR